MPPTTVSEQQNDIPEIPRILHYVWIGPRPLPSLAQKCIQSWRTHLPDFTVRFWNEENSPMDHPYVAAMYARKKWAFVSDYIRFWALSREGGVYLDTDQEVLRPLDVLLEQQAFLGKTSDGMVACGIIGARPNDPFIHDVCRVYDSDSRFDTNDTSPRIVTRLIREGNYSHVRIYPSSYFYPCDDGVPCAPERLSQAYARHHWAESWVPYARMRKMLRRLGVIRWYKNITSACLLLF